MVSGGFRPTAPQNNFAVSATGGNGNSGKQPIRVAPGGQYGSRTASVQQQKGAPMAAATPTAPSPGAQGPVTPTPPVVHPLTGDTGVSGDPITHGAPFGRGGGPEVLPQGFQGDTRKTENSQIVQQYAPALMEAMKAPNVPDSYKRFVNSLFKDIQGG